MPGPGLTILVTTGPRGVSSIRSVAVPTFETRYSMICLASSWFSLRPPDQGTQVEQGEPLIEIGRFPVENLEIGRGGAEVAAKIIKEQARLGVARGSPGRLVASGRSTIWPSSAILARRAATLPGPASSPGSGKIVGRSNVWPSHDHGGQAVL